MIRIQSLTSIVRTMVSGVVSGLPGLDFSLSNKLLLVLSYLAIGPSELVGYEIPGSRKERGLVYR